MELMEATANDMVVVADVEDDSLLDQIMETAEEFFKKQSTVSAGKQEESVKSGLRRWKSCLMPIWQ